MPLLKDEKTGKSLPGKWDPLVAERLPKALFKELGQTRAASDGGVTSVTAQLQRACPIFFSSADESSLKGWRLLKRSQQPGTDEASRAQLLKEALAVFRPIVGSVKHDDLVELISCFVSQRMKLLKEPAAHAASLAAIEDAVARLTL